MKIKNTIKIKYLNQEGFISQQWYIEGTEKNGSGKLQNFIRSAKASILTGNLGALRLRAIGDSFKYIENTSIKSGFGNFFVALIGLIFCKILI